MGIRGVRFVYHSDWSDPEIIWHRHVMNIHDVEDPMWDIYSERCRENGTSPNDEEFKNFCRKETDLMREYAQCAIDSGNARRLKNVRFRTDFFSADAPALRAIPE